MSIKLELTEDMFRYILNAVARCPYIEVKVIIDELQRQAQASKQPATGALPK